MAQLNGVAVGVLGVLRDERTIVAWTDEGKVYQLSPFEDRWIELKSGPWIKPIPTTESPSR